MASVASNLKKLVNHRIPLIRFKYGGDRSGAVHHASVNKKVEPTMHKTVAATSAPKTSQNQAPLEFAATPKKYRRRPLTQAEIDLVTIGGFT